MKQYDTYLFDMDGTVIKSLSHWLDMVKDATSQHDINADDKTIVRTVFGNPRGLITLGVPEDELEQVYRKWDANAVEKLPEVPMYEDSEKVLRRLKAEGKRLALITATIRPTVEAILVSKDLGDVFDFVICGDEIKLHKPSPESLLTAMEQLGARKESTVMVGDSEKDVKAAHNAGIDSILFFPDEHHTFHDRKELLKDRPTYVISDWSEL